MATTRPPPALLQIHHLFNNHRLQDRAPILFVLLMAYFPIGIVLMLLRIIMSLQHLVILAILPKHWLVRKILMRIYLFVMGILVIGERTPETNPDIVVSNYLSHLDSIVIEAVFPTTRLAKQTKLPAFFRWLFGFLEDDTSCVGLECLGTDYPISFFPEETTSNGRCGLLKFNAALFSKSELTVLPLLISVYRPTFIPVNIHCIESTFWADLLWTLFFPCTKFHVKYLTPLKNTPDNEEGREEFAKQLQTDMASGLHVEPTAFTAKDKNDYIKRLKHDEKIKEQQVFKARYTPRRAGSQADEMAKQVKAVLPQVPLNLIKLDVMKTKNVDVTISNFLDGSIQFQPLTEEEQQSEKAKIAKSTQAAVTASVLASQLHNKLQHLSFQERKELMIEEARKTYLDKHPEYA